MSSGKIFLKTIKFVWAKFLLGLATVVVGIVLLAILGGIGFAINIPVLFYGLFALWIILISSFSFALNHYFGYLVKAGHVAMVTQAATTGELPENQFETATQIVKERFVTSNIFFVIDRLVSGAVKQLQSGVQTVDNLLGNIPGVSHILAFLKIFIGVALNYVDECCLAYIFYKKDEDAFKSAADGIVIYWQNWKKLLKNALMLSLLVVAISAVVGIAIFGIAMGILNALVVSSEATILIFVASLIFGILIASSVKTAFVDSFIMVKMICEYMSVAPSTEVRYDLYEKLCKLSSKFKNLFSKAEGEIKRPSVSSSTTYTNV